MRIVPIHPSLLDAPIEEAPPSSTDAPSTDRAAVRRTLGFRKNPARRTLGVRK